MVLSLFDYLFDCCPFPDDHGPFKSLQQLLEQENSLYLSVFLNFVLSNSNPSQLLFYLISGLYKEGTVKDMRKWAYEIHSTFLVPRAPLMWEGVDESLAREVDDVLQNEHDKVEILRKIFWKSRHRAKECIVQQLAEFQTKRTAGLGTMFGPSDQQLLEAKGDKVKEQRIVEDTLLPKLQQLIDDVDTSNECPKKMALSSALSTVLHRIFLITRSTPGGPVERVHHFVSREKSFKNRLIGKNRKIMVRGHHLVLKQYYEVAHCNHCQNIIWGVSPQGYHCTNCELNIHRSCSRVLEENCPGPVPTKNDKMSKFIEKIRPAHYFNPGTHQPNPTQFASAWCSISISIVHWWTQFSICFPSINRGETQTTRRRMRCGWSAASWWVLYSVVMVELNETRKKCVNQMGDSFRIIQHELLDSCIEKTNIQIKWISSSLILAWKQVWMCYVRFICYIWYWL